MFLLHNCAVLEEHLRVTRPVVTRRGSSQPFVLCMDEAGLPLLSTPSATLILHQSHICINIVTHGHTCTNMSISLRRLSSVQILALK